MSKPSRRANREEIKAQSKQRKRAQKALFDELKRKGLNVCSHATISNHKCEYKDEDEERRVRNEVCWDQLKVFRAKLPILLRQLSKIPDPRNPKKTRHKITILLIYGILVFVLQMSSSREATREMSRPMFWENLKSAFPELEDVPHHDRLKRLLEQIDVDQIQSTQIELIREWIRKKKLNRYLINGCYPIALDGTRKFARDWIWDEECLERTVGSGETSRSRYYVYVLQASPAFQGGMSIPLMSEFLTYTQDDSCNSKQDCELKAFHRPAARIKEAFPALRIILFLDGLYANGPVMERCRKYKWQYMIVLQDKSLPSVHDEFEAISELEPKNRYTRLWGNRRQNFRWANDIDYDFVANGKKTEIIHVIECIENWREIEKGGSRIVEKSARHLWISSEPLNRQNLHERCNLGARSRWTIEEGFLVEKHHGYGYEHCFSYDSNVMKGYHYLMQPGHMFNVMARYSEGLAKIVKNTGIRGLIRFVRDSIGSPWLDRAWIAERLAGPFQLRLV
ncbi:MAG: transposase family protein [Syntrophobacteraceae bacterium]